MCYHASVEIRGQPVGVGSPLPLCMFQELNSGCQAWQQVPLPAEPSHQLSSIAFSCLYLILCADSLDHSSKRPVLSWENRAILVFPIATSKHF